jgi:hypothetical protein
VGFVDDKVALGQAFFREHYGFPCQFYSTGVPLLGRTKKIYYLHHRVAQ